MEKQETNVINPFEQGPYVQVAAFCEQVIEGKDGVLSLIRIIDTLTHTEYGPTAPTQMPSMEREIKLVITLKSGRSRGRYDIDIVPLNPLGEAKAPFTTSIHLEGEERGVNLILNLRFQFEHEGLYWFNIYFDGKLLTRVPFRTKYARVTTGST